MYMYMYMYSVRTCTCMCNYYRVCNSIVPISCNTTFLANCS